jgi:hypothetical protein
MVISNPRRGLLRTQKCLELSWAGPICDSCKGLMLLFPHGSNGPLDSYHGIIRSFP